MGLFTMRVSKDLFATSFHFGENHSGYSWVILMRSFG